MNFPILTPECQPQPPAKVRAPSAGRTYVMQGLQCARALETYHLIFAPTHACNLRCKHCYLPDHASSVFPEDLALRLVDQWSDITLSERGAFQGIFHVKGGEPFVVPYLGRIFDRLVELQSLRLMLTTNGTFTKPEVLDVLARCNDGLHGHVTVIVSLDGATAETHERLRGTGQFGTTMSFLDAMRRIGINTFLNCVLRTDNLHEVQEYLELAKSLRVAQVNFLPLVPRGFGGVLRCHQAPQLAVHKEVQRAYDEGDEQTRSLLAGSLSHILDRAKTGGTAPAHECVAAYRGLFYITPDGSTYTCPNLIGTEHRIGNAASEQLLRIMERLPNLHRSLRKTGQSDRFLCTGERLHRERDVGGDGLRGLAELQRTLDRELDANPHRSPRPLLAYCVSRNF